MMNKVKKTKARELRRKNRVRAKISGTANRPRLSVFRSNCGLYLQIIDDTSGKTLASAHTKELKDKKFCLYRPCSSSLDTAYVAHKRSDALEPLVLLKKLCTFFFSLSTESCSALS